MGSVELYYHILSKDNSNKLILTVEKREYFQKQDGTYFYAQKNGNTFVNINTEQLPKLLDIFDMFNLLDFPFTFWADKEYNTVPEKIKEKIILLIDKKVSELQETKFFFNKL